MREERMPNFHLRRLRELRGWSLQRVADEIQSRWPDAALTGKEVGRWERGVRTPGPYYREKLCIIFETDAAHLGLIAASTKEDEKTEIDFPPSQSRFVEGKDQQIIQLTHEDLTILSEILHCRTFFANSRPVARYKSNIRDYWQSEGGSTGCYGSLKNA